MSPCKAFLALLFVIISLTGSVLASNVEFGTPIEAQIVSAKPDPGKSKGNWVIKAELLEGSRGPGMKWTPKATVVEIKAAVEQRVNFSKGQKLQVQWMKYSGMGSNGPVSSTSWKLAP